VLQKLAEEINFLLQVSGPLMLTLYPSLFSNTLEHPHGIALKSELSWASLTYASAKKPQDAIEHLVVITLLIFLSKFKFLIGFGKIEV